MIYRGSRRATSVALALAILGLLGTALPAAAAPLPEIKVPKARPGAAILVTYRDEAAARRGDMASDTAQAGETVEALNLRVFHAPRGQEQRVMRELATSPGVETIESDAPVESTATPNDPLWHDHVRWAHDKASMRPAWDITKGSADVVIAILDSGMEVAHPEFSGRVVPGYDFVENDTTTNDPRGHGTMSAGAAGARGNNGAGVAGTCWTCRIMPVRVLNANGSGYASWAIKGITWAADRGADVISMSFGGFSPTTAFQNAIVYARSKGAVVVASAGNEGNTAKFYPAHYLGVISVAASDPSDRPYSWSNRGEWIDLAAPGCFWTTRTGKSYGNFCGTSASAPLVAGIVGLMRAKNPLATRVQLEKTVLETATDLSWLNHGRVNALAALKRIAAVPLVAPTPAPAQSGPVAWLEQSGRVVIEAERANARISRNGKNWIDGTIKKGYAGPGYVAAWEDTGFFRNTNYATTSPELRYLVKFTTTGTYTIWIRTWAPDAAGDSVHVGANGKALAAADKVTTGLHGYWAWTRSTMDGTTARILVTKPGVYTINVWAREDGLRIDRLVITKGAIPVGSGPSESKRVSI